MSDSLTKPYLGQNLIFLISQPRAGSTLTQRILAAHPEISTSAEPWIMLPPLYTLRPENVQVDYDSNLAWMALQDYLDVTAGGEELYYSAVRSFAQTLYNAALEKEGKSIFLDKTPRYYLIIEKLIKVFPEAKIVLLFRNPLAVLASIMKNWVQNDPNRLMQHQQDLIEAPWLMCRAYEKFGKRLNVIRYEDLVKDPEKEIKKFCNDSGITFHPHMLEYSDQKGTVGLMGDAINVYRHQRPMANYSDRWIQFYNNPNYRYLAEIYVDGLGDDLLKKMGYDKETIKEELSANSPRIETIPDSVKQRYTALLGLPGDISSRCETNYRKGNESTQKARKVAIKQQLDLFLQYQKYDEAKQLISLRNPLLGDDADYIYLRAKFSYHNGERGAAKKDLNFIIKNHPEDVRAMLFGAQLYEQEGKIPQAFKIIEKAYKQMPDNLEVIKSYICLSYQLKKIECLESPLKKLIKYNVNDQEALKMLVEIYEGMGKKKDAEKYRELIKKAMR